MNKNLKIISIIAPVILFLTSCSANSISKQVEVQSLAELSHIHSVATDGKNLYVASHHGLYVLKKNGWKLRGEDFDIMGLAFSEGVFYASGHPGPLQNLPDPVGVLVSHNQGNTWRPLSLTGEVDFHLLEVSQENFIGAAANLGEILKSKDGGQTWQSTQVPVFSDMTLNPILKNEILLATKSGLRYSMDFANTFEDIAGPKNVSKVEWNQEFVFVADEEFIYIAENLQTNFEKLDYEFKGISDINSEKNVIIVLDENGVHASFDSGDSFAQIASLN